MPVPPSIHKRIWRLAWPLLLSNLTAPLLGLVDTAVVGHLNSPDYLAAVALGSNYFMFLYFSFNFLRMSTSGLAAQAIGSSKPALIVLIRALFLSLLLGIGLIAVNPWLEELGLTLLGGSQSVQTLAAEYIGCRILGAPAAFANFAIIGFAVGTQRTRVPFKMTLLMHTLNAILSYVLVYVWHFDVRGVGTASAIADYIGLFAALYWLRAGISVQALRHLIHQGLLQLKPLLELLGVNRDLFIRSLVLLSMFLFFTAQGARLGDTILAANAVLITFFLVLSSILDGFANAAEALVGEARGAASYNAMQRAVGATALWIMAIALLVFIGFLLLGPLFIGLLTDIPGVRTAAIQYLPWLLAMPFTASAGFWLDGVFIGATRARSMRNTMLFSVLVFLLIWWATRGWGNHGLWLAMNSLMAVRGLSMGWVWLLPKRSDKTLMDAAKAAITHQDKMTR